MKKWFEKIKQNLNIYNVVIAVCGIILLGSVSVLFGFSVLNGGLIVASSKQSVASYYLIEADCVEKYDDAVSLSNDIQNLGGAGYIRYDGGYHVFISGYLTKKDAEKVLNKTENFKNKKIYVLSIDDFNNDNSFNEKLNRVIKNNILSFKYSIENLNNLIIGFDKDEIGLIEFKTKAMIIVEELELQISNLQSNFVQNSVMYKYQSYIYEFRNCFADIASLDVEKNEFSRIVKYKEISCMFCLQKILNIF